MDVRSRSAKLVNQAAVAVVVAAEEAVQEAAVMVAAVTVAALAAAVEAVAAAHVVAVMAEVAMAADTVEEVAVHLVINSKERFGALFFGAPGMAHALRNGSFPSFSPTLRKFLFPSR